MVVRLPYDCLQNALSFLKAEELFHCGKVCTQWQEAATWVEGFEPLFDRIDHFIKRWEGEQRAVLTCCFTHHPDCQIRIQLFPSHRKRLRVAQEEQLRCGVPLSKGSPPLTYHDTFPPVIYREVPPSPGAIGARVVLPQEDLMTYSLVALRIQQIVESYALKRRGAFRV